MNFKKWCEENNPRLLEEWDYELNEKFPEEYFSAEKKRVHWVKEVEKVCKT